MKSDKILLLSFLLIISCKHNVEQTIQKEAIKTVSVQSPVFMKYSESVRASGILTPRAEVKLSFKTGGIVKEVNVREGESVKEGDILASLDLSEISAQGKQASIGAEKARRDYKRASNLYKDSVATLETLENAKSAYELALAQKRIAEFNLKHSKIVAPANGKVQKILVKKNEITAPGYPVILFATTDNDWIIRVSLADKDIVKFFTGDSSSIQMDAFPDRIFTAFISEVGSLADPLTGTYEVELLLDETDHNFRTGFIARVNIFPSDSISGLWVPFESVHNLNGNRGYVYTIYSNRVIKKEVLTGKLKSDGILILDGLTEKDTLVTEGADFIDENSEVNFEFIETPGK